MKIVYRRIITLSLLVLLFGFIFMIFYKVEIKYLTPTDTPIGYKPILVSSLVDLDGDLFSQNQSTFFHFYNPDCPCSRFNVEHVQDLIKTYNNDLKFVIVAQYNDERTLEQVTEQFLAKENITIYIDQNKEIAEKLGVYSTPQAVIVNKKGELYFRGNYNKSRFCTDPNKFYAKQAIDSLIAQKTAPHFDASATESYGCSLYEEKDILDKILILN